jgi:hypothetical protein
MTDKKMRRTMPIKTAINCEARFAAASEGCVIPKVLMKAFARRRRGFIGFWGLTLHPVGDVTSFSLLFETASGTAGRHPIVECLHQDAYEACRWD